MKKQIVEITKKNLSDIEGKKISRKEAIKRTGYIAASAATTMILLGSPKAQACSEATHRDDRGGKRRDDRHK